MYNVQLMYNVQCAMCNVQCTINVQCAMCNDGKDHKRWQETVAVR